MAFGELAQQRDALPRRQPVLGVLALNGPGAAALADVVTGDKETIVKKEAAKTLAAIGPKAAAVVKSVPSALPTRT